MKMTSPGGTSVTVDDDPAYVAKLSEAGYKADGLIGNLRFADPDIEPDADPDGEALPAADADRQEWADYAARNGFADVELDALSAADIAALFDAPSV